MSLGQLSLNLIKKTAQNWDVPKDYWDPLYGYLVQGLDPGGFWSSVLSNDWFRAIEISHPLNQVQELKNASGWIQSTWPKSSWGSDSAVRFWLSLDDQGRKDHLEAAVERLARSEVEQILKGHRPVPE